MTGRPTGSPSSAAAEAVRGCTRSPPSSSGGTSPARSARPYSSGSGGTAGCRSSHGADASDRSSPHTPVIRRKSHPPQVSAARDRARTSGSACRNTVSTACGSPALPSDPVRRNAASSTPSRRHTSTTATTRASFHSTAGRVGRPSASTSQAPSPCAVIASARTGPGRAVTNDRTVVATAAQTSSGSCSERSGAGRCTAASACVTATSRPAASNATALITVVPASTHTITPSVIRPPHRPGVTGITDDPSEHRNS